MMNKNELLSHMNDVVTIDEIVEAKMKTMKGMKKASMLGLIRELLEENIHNMSDDALVDEVYDMRKLGVMK